MLQIIIYTILSGLLLYFLGRLFFQIKKHWKKKQYKKMISEKMKTLEEIKDDLLLRAQPPISPDLLINVFRENFGFVEYDLT